MQPQNVWLNCQRLYYKYKKDYKNIKIMFKQSILTCGQQMDWKFDWEKNISEMEEEEIEDEKDE